MTIANETHSTLVENIFKVFRIFPFMNFDHQKIKSSLMRIYALFKILLQVINFIFPEFKITFIHL